jgi:hypothetical protein
MSKRLNPDATAAVNAARAGNCKDAMKYLYDAAPHNQTQNCGGDRWNDAVSDFRHANVVVAGACAVNAGKSTRHTPGFDGARRRRRKRR